MWDAKTGPRSSPSRGTPSSSLSVSFSPDGSRIVTGSDDKTAKVWDAKSGAEMLTLKGHTTSSSGRRRSARTGRGSSPGVTTGRRRCGTRRAGAEVLTLKGHTMASFRRRSARTGRGS